jgi:hypothetical protein
MKRATLKFLVLSLAIYVAVHYHFAFSQAALGPRHAIRLAIGLLEIMILWGLLQGDFRLLIKGIAQGKTRILAGLVVVFLAAVLFVHGDMVLTRHRGGELGYLGSLERMKERLLWAQGCYLIGILFLKAWAAGHRNFIRPRCSKDDFILLLLVLIPLVNYQAQNREYFDFAAAVRYLVILLAWPAGLLLVLQVLQQALGTEKIAAPLAAGMATVYYSMPLISGLLQRPVELLFPLQLAIAGAVCAVLIVAYRAARRSTVKAVLIMAICSATGSWVQASFSGNARTASGSTRPSSPGKFNDPELVRLLTAPARHRPDVYLLIYDGYAAPRMLPHYGLAKLSAVPYLQSRGFRIYDKAYSFFPSSLLSMRSVLGMEPSPAAGIGRANLSYEFFHRQGYQTSLVLNAYLLGGSTPLVVDSVFPPWNFRSGLGALYRGIGGGEFKSEVVFKDRPIEEWLAAKRAVLTLATGPKMLYAHSGMPGHSQISGACLEDERERYGRRLAAANEEMKQDIELILKAHRQAIIIVAGDHGPYLTGDCRYMARTKPQDLQAIHFADRYGMLLAVRWPDGDAPQLEDDLVLQNVFFAVADYMLNDRRVWDHRLKIPTTGYGGIPDGAIQDGMVRIGKDRGKPLFKAIDSD